MGARVLPSRREFLVLFFAARMPASDSSLHPLGRPVEFGEIRFALRSAASAGETLGLECVYRPHRERDVKKTRHLNLLRGWIGGGSRDWIRVQHEEFHSVRRRIAATGSDVSFVVPLRDPEDGHDAYQLDAVRIVGGVMGNLSFERWFAAPPKLHPGFGLACTATELRGVLRPSGLGAQPLRGSPPLWAGLRTVDLEFVPMEVPAVRLFESSAKHHWDGWRQTTPHTWPGGRTIVVRHVGAPTVWREHEYFAFPPASESGVVEPVPPRGVLPGVHLEVFWPEGESLAFPETRFERDVTVVATPVSKLPARTRELLAESVRLRPGCEPSSMSADQWAELETSVAKIDPPVSVEMASAADGERTLRVGRGRGFAEPWLYAFGAAYETGRRFVVTCLVLSPERWTGSLPE